MAHQASMKRVFPQGSSQHRLLDADPRRVAVILFPMSTQGYSVSPNPMADISDGVYIPLRMTPTKLCACDVGDWIRHGLNVWPEQAGDQVVCLDIVEDGR